MAGLLVENYIGCGAHNHYVHVVYQQIRSRSKLNAAKIHVTHLRHEEPVHSRREINAELKEDSVGCSGTERRSLIFSSAFALSSFIFPFSAISLGDPTVTVEQVTRYPSPSKSLSPSEELVVELFQRSTYSVVNVFDITLRPQANSTGSVDVPEGNGSGIVWDAEGHIVTNFHVIGSALSQNPPAGSKVARVTILGADGFQRNFEAALVGADRSKDLAVLKVEAPPSLLQPLPLGSVVGLRVGQRVFAIGNPFGFDHTLTAGVLSGLNRSIASSSAGQSGTSISGGLQTDAAINPGNSGGPLLDSAGRLLGINTAIFTRTGTSAGVGFAIPVDTVARLVPQIIQFGKVVRPGIGVQLAADPVALQLNVKEGALVLSVKEGSAADRAGLKGVRRGFGGGIQLGDVIVGIGARRVAVTADVSNILEEYSVGDSVEFTLLRNGVTEFVRMTLEES